MNLAKAILLPLCLICGMTMAVGCNQDPDQGPYSDYINTQNTEYLVLLNKTHPSGEHYCPPDLTTLDKEQTLYGKEVQLRQYAAQATEAMIKELHAQGYTDIVVTSGYRSYSYQQSLFNTYIGQEMAAHPDWTWLAASRKMAEVSVAGGKSSLFTIRFAKAARRRSIKLCSI